MHSMEKHERLRDARLKAGFASGADAARRLGIPYGTYSGHENGSRGIKNNELFQYAKAFKVSPIWLMFGLPEVEENIQFSELMGFAGRLPNGQVEILEQDDPEGEILCPDDLLQTVSYVKIVGPYMNGLAQNGWIVFVDDDFSVARHEMHGGMLALCQMIDNKYFFRYVYPSAVDKTFDLEFPGISLERSVALKAISAVRLIVPDLTVYLMRQMAQVKLDMIGARVPRKPTSSGS